MRSPNRGDLIVIIIGLLYCFGYISGKHLSLVLFVALMGAGFALIAWDAYKPRK
jgi:hypothetical protein